MRAGESGPKGFIAAIRKSQRKGIAVAKDPTFDRRKYPRVRTEALVSITWLDSSDVVAHAMDLSLGGIRFQCADLEFELGQMLRVTLKLGEQEASLVGKTVRVTELDAFVQEVGLALIDVDARTLELLHEQLEDLQE